MRLDAYMVEFPGNGLLEVKRVDLLLGIRLLQLLVR